MPRLLCGRRNNQLGVLFDDQKRGDHTDLRACLRRFYFGTFISLSGRILLKRLSFWHRIRKQMKGDSRDRLPSIGLHDRHPARTTREESMHKLSVLVTCIVVMLPANAVLA